MKEKEWTNEERLELLSIDNEKQENIKNLDFKKIDIDREEYNHIQAKKIEIKKLQGINRTVESNNWLELLFELHKLHNFDKFKASDFIKYISQLSTECTDLPEVIEYQGEFYIDGNGKHRLTIAKCLGIKHCLVIVRKTHE